MHPRESLLVRARVVYVRRDGRTVMSGSVFDVEPAPADEQDPAAMEMAVLTDVQGNFRFRVNAPVQFQMSADYGGYVTGQLSPTNTTATLNDITIELQPESTISGRVIDADTGEPVGGIGVGVNSSKFLMGFVPWAVSPSTTDADGSYPDRGSPTRRVPDPGLTAPGRAVG